MSVHSNFYMSEEEYLRDLKAEYDRAEYHKEHPEVLYGCPTDEYLERQEEKENEQQSI